MRTDSAALWLRAASGIYGLGAAVYHGAYDVGLLRGARLPVPVWSVGNLTVGGTGKTPVVRELVQALVRAGRRPAVLTRGYGRRGPGGLLRGGLLDGRPTTAVEVGDEPFLFARWLPEVPVAVGARRARAARALLARGAADCFVLDDGFQHRALLRDVDLVLLDAERPLGNGHLLPAGPLREPPRSLERATHLLTTGGGRREEAETSLTPGRPFCRAWPVPGPVQDLRAAPWPALRGLRVWGVAGIARPERFRALLEAEGAEVVGFSAYRDHHPFTAADVAREESAATGAEARPVTTEKDAVRLEPYAAPGTSWGVLEIRMEIEGGWDAFVARLLAS